MPAQVPQPPAAYTSSHATTTSPSPSARSSRAKFWAFARRPSRCATSVPRGHKIALRDLLRGRRSASTAGRSGGRYADIAAGALVHTANLATRLDGLTDYVYRPVAPPAACGGRAAETFMGYRRANGRVGTRNEIWILCTVGCVARTARAHRARRHGALQRPRRWRARVHASVRLLAARRRSRAHAAGARRARHASERGRRADPRARLRIESARRTADRDRRRRSPRACAPSLRRRPTTKTRQGLDALEELVARRGARPARALPARRRSRSA